MQVMSVTTLCVCYDNVTSSRSVAYNCRSPWYEALMRWVKYCCYRGQGRGVPSFKDVERWPLVVALEGLVTEWRMRTTHKHLHLLLLRRSPLASWIKLSQLMKLGDQGHSEHSITGTPDASEYVCDAYTSFVVSSHLQVPLLPFNHIWYPGR